MKEIKFLFIEFKNFVYIKKILSIYYKLDFLLLIND